MVYVRLHHRLSGDGWRRVRIFVGTSPDRMQYRGDLSLIDNADDEWSPIRDALFQGAGVEVEEIEEVST